MTDRCKNCGSSITFDPPCCSSPSPPSLFTMAGAGAGKLDNPSAVAIVASLLGLLLLVMLASFVIATALGLFVRWFVYVSGV